MNNNPLLLLRDWFESLVPREKLLVSICAVVIVVAGLWAGVIQPLFTGTAELRERVDNKTAQLASLQELASQIPRLSDAQSGASGPAAGGNESIVVVIDRTVRDRQLQQHLKRNQPDGTGGVRLRFEGAAFDDLIELLGELRKNYGMMLVSANFDEAGPGRVNCSIVMALASG